MIDGQTGSKRREIITVCAILVCALLWQAWLYITGRTVLDGDECYLAIQGLHILKGARPVFYFAQDYMGCIEAYGFALFYLVFGSCTPLAVKIFASLQMLLYLGSSYLLVRRFFGFAAAVFTLILLSFPPNLLAVWIIKMRGYMPFLILGNGILYMILWLEEKNGGNVKKGSFALLGFLMGLAWWANPLSIFFCVFVAIISLLSPPLRKDLWTSSRSKTEIFINVIMLIILLILESRSIFPTRKFAFLRSLFHYRGFVFPGIFISIAAVSVILVKCRKRNFNLAFLCAGFIVGNAPMLFAYWNKELLNLKQGLGGWFHFRDNVTLFPFFVFPVLTGITDIFHFLYRVIFPPVAVVVLVMIYISMLYYTIRSFPRMNRSKRSILALFVVIFLLLCMQNSTVWTHSRYLLGFYMPLFVLMSIFFVELNKRLKGLGIAFLCAILIFHIGGTLYSPRHNVILPSGLYPYEKDILSFCRKNRLEEVFVQGSDDLVNRLTFFSGEDILFLNPSGYFNRIPEYEEKFCKRSHFPLFVPDNTESKYKPERLPDVSIPGFEIYLNVPKHEIKDIYFSHFLR